MSKTHSSNKASQESHKQIEVYTDGSALGNPGRGGYAVLAKSNGRTRTITGRVMSATNNRMELKAIECALRKLPSDQELVIHSDSRYAVDGSSHWIKGWRQRGWRTASGSPVANADLWKKIDRLLRRRKARVIFVWVRGHAGDQYNEEVDRLARNRAAMG